MRAPYVAAKWATIGLTRSLSMELGAYNIRVNAVLPGSVRGDRMGHVMQARAQTTCLSLREVEAEETAAISLVRLIDPAETRENFGKSCKLKPTNITPDNML